MYRDPIVEEIHQIRGEIAEEFNYNIEAIARETLKQQGASGKVVINAPLRPAIAGDTSPDASKQPSS